MRNNFGYFEVHFPPSDWKSTIVRPSVLLLSVTLILLKEYTYQTRYFTEMLPFRVSRFWNGPPWRVPLGFPKQRAFNFYVVIGCNTFGVSEHFKGYQLEKVMGAIKTFYDVFAWNIYVYVIIITYDGVTSSTMVFPDLLMGLSVDQFMGLTVLLMEKCSINGFMNFIVNLFYFLFYEFNLKIMGLFVVIFMGL